MANSSSSYHYDFSSGGVFSWLFQGIQGIFEAITKGLSYINPFSEENLYKDLFKILDYLNPFSENFILKSVLDFLGDILSFLNPFDENFFGKKIIDLLGDLLKALFIPKEESISNISNSVKSKFAFIDTINAFVNTFGNDLGETGVSPTFTLGLSATKYTNQQDYVILDMSWYAPFKEYGDLIITSFCYAFFLWRLFIKLPSIINGSGGDIISSSNTYTRISKGGK